MSTCSQCKFFEADSRGLFEADSGRIVGVCRRYPPVVVVDRWKSENGIITNEVMTVDRVRYELPKTSEKSFCGEFST